MGIEGFGERERADELDSYASLNLFSWLFFGVAVLEDCRIKSKVE